MICINRWQAHYTWHCTHTYTCDCLNRYLKHSIHMNTVDWCYSDTNITWSFVNMEYGNNHMEMCCFFQIESIWLWKVSNLNMCTALTVHTCTSTQTQSTHALLPPPSSGLTWWWWCMKNLNFLPSLTPLVLQLLYVWQWDWHSLYWLLDHTWTLVHWHASLWNKNQYNHKTDITTYTSLP